MYRFQVRVLTQVNPQTYVWKDVHPSDEAMPYRYETKAEAENMARICYGNDPTIVRVVEE